MMQVSVGHGGGTEAAEAQNERLLAEAQGDSRTSEKGRIEKAGKDFESILLGSWLQGAETTFAAAPGGDDDEEDDGSKGQFTGLAMQQLASTLVNSGGIGIGRMIAEHLEAASMEKAPAVQAGEPKA